MKEPFVNLMGLMTIEEPFDLLTIHLNIDIQLIVTTAKLYKILQFETVLLM
jgi:hypothetical protein